jgi:hypothetical protein
MAIFTFEGPTELYVHPSAKAAEGYFEAIDVETCEYVFLGDGGHDHQAVGPRRSGRAEPHTGEAGARAAPARRRPRRESMAWLQFWLQLATFAGVRPCSP